MKNNVIDMVGARNERCLRALEHFIGQARQTCQLLRAVATRPATVAQRVELYDQRVKENHAHEAYQALRQQLFESLH